ncbi:MAG TPA: cbb3-type cytochrome c oxidase subunit 3 [Ignavibacteria bacterium]|nr:cbb3-type cytochrome c oxidase subunit 3 [Ignavibacteria bacterium]
MYKQVLQSITGIEIYPVIALIMFFLFFLLIVGWIFTLNKKYISRMENIPLDDNINSKEVNNFNAGGVK